MEGPIRREQYRIAVPLTIVLESASGNREARISDFSMGGCYVDSISSVRQDECVRFTLALPSGRTLDMSGTVVYIHEGIGFGLQFSDITREQRIALEQVILASGGTV